MNIVEGILRELLTMPKRGEYFPPEIISDCTDCEAYRVLTVRASNARDLNKYTDGISIAGRRIVHRKVGKNTWQIHTECNS